MAAAVGLWWERDSSGYDIEFREGSTEKSLLGGESDGFFIVARGGEPVRYWIDGLSYRVFEKLADTPMTPEGALEFTNRWGFLGEFHARGMWEGEFYRLVRSCCVVLNLAKRNAYEELSALLRKSDQPLDKAGIGKFSVDLVCRPGSKLPRVFIHPQSLMSFIWLEVMQLIAEGNEIRRCPQCGKFFTVGPETGRNTNRVFCSDKCKSADYRARKIKRAK